MTSDPPLELTDEELEGLAVDSTQFGPRRVLLEDEPTMLVARYLFPTERYRGEWKRHWVSLGKSLGVIGVYEFLLTYIASERIVPEYRTEAMAVVAIVVVAAATYAFLDWHVTRFVITNKRIMLIRGVFLRDVAMQPLLRVTDLRFRQTLLSRLLNYGSFHVDGAGRRSGMRRIKDLPNPNELYLRVIEELYEPLAVEARLGTAVEDSVREVLQGPVLTNYDGWVGVEIRDGDDPLPLADDRTVPLAPGRSYELVVTISPDPATDVTEPLIVTGGVDKPEATFDVEVDSDRSSLRRRRLTVEVPLYESREARFVLEPVVDDLDPPPWLWVRVSQGRRTLQSIELQAEEVPTARPGGAGGSSDVEGEAEVTPG